MSASSPLPMRATRRELDAWTPGAAWDLDRYLNWLLDQARRRGAQQILLVLTARGCAGCETLKGQLEAHAEALQGTLAVLAEAGTLGEACFFAIRLGAVELFAPGLPTTWRLREVAGGLEVSAVSLGPLDPPDVGAQLRALVDGQSRACREARGVPVEIRRGGQTQRVDPSRFEALRVPLPAAP